MMISNKSITEASRELRNLDVRNGCKRQQRHVEYSGGGARESIVLLSMNGRKYTTIDYPALHTF